MDTKCLTLPVSNTKPCSIPVAATSASAICSPWLSTMASIKAVARWVMAGVNGKMAAARYASMVLRAASSALLRMPCSSSM